MCKYGCGCWRHRTARAGKLYRVRSRLYRNGFLQINTHLKALAEIHTKHSFPVLSDHIFFVKIWPTICQTIANFAEISCIFCLFFFKFSKQLAKSVSGQACLVFSEFPFQHVAPKKKSVLSFLFLPLELQRPPEAKRTTRNPKPGKEREGYGSSRSLSSFSCTRPAGR